MRYSNEVALSVADISDAGTGSAIDTGNAYRVSYQAVTTGTPTSFIVKIQVSNDMPAGAGGNFGSFTPTNWSDLANSSTTITAAGVTGISAIEISHRWIRVVSAADAGDGTLSVRVNTQGF